MTDDRQQQQQKYPQRSQNQPQNQAELPPRRFRNIVLTGMPGSGKSSVGKTYAYLTKRNFVDLDRVIEHSVGKSISQIFSDDGEDAFRNAEARALKKISRYHNCVIALGGGTLCNDEHLNIARQMGFVIYLESPTTIISSRIFSDMQTKPRPLFANVQGIEQLSVALDELLANRVESYTKADHVIRTGYSSVDASALEMLACEGKAFHREYQRLVAAVGREPPLSVFPQGQYWMLKRYQPRRDSEPKL